MKTFFMIRILVSLKYNNNSFPHINLSTTRVHVKKNMKNQIQKSLGRALKKLINIEIHSEKEIYFLECIRLSKSCSLF